MSYVQKHCKMLATFEFNFSFHLFVKHYSNTLCTQMLVENAINKYIQIRASYLVEIDLKFNLRVFKFKKFLWGACPHTPLEGLYFALHPEKIPLIYNQPKFQMANQIYFWLAVLSEQNFILI